jgi:SAM-dependent methyltransferase
MNRRAILGELSAMARERDSFLASEVRARIGGDHAPGDLRRILLSFLDDLGLRGEPRGGDLLISRLPPGRPVLPSPQRLRSDAQFLLHPALPEGLQEHVEEYVTKKTGKAWNDPIVLERIRAAIRVQKGEYWGQAGGRAISYRAGYRVLAYLAYQMPVSLTGFGHIIHGMAADGLLSDRMRVLDIGSGPGTFPLAIADAWGRLAPGTVRISALEKETENLEAYRSLVPACAAGDPSVRIAEPLQDDLRSVDPKDLPSDFDLLTFGNVLSELRDLAPDEKAALVERLSRSLAPDGTLVIMEPADLENSVALRRLTGALARRGLNLYAPCTSLWSTACVPDRCWTFREEPRIAPTRLMSRLAATDDGYRYLNTDVKFSYAILRKDGRTRETYRVPRGERAIRLSRLPGHLKRRVNVVVAKMSGDLGGGHGDHVFKVCDGTPRKPVFAVVPPHQATHARPLLDGQYGEIFSLGHVLVRYNPARDAFNLFVDRSAGISRPRSPGKGKMPMGRRKPAGDRGPGQRDIPDKKQRSSR